MLTMCLIFCGCSSAPQDAAELLERAQAACALLHSYSTSYKMEICIQPESGDAETSLTQIYTDLNLDADTTVCSVITSATGNGGSRSNSVLSYYIPDDEGGYRRFFSYDQENWYVQALAQDTTNEEGFAYLSKIPFDIALSKEQYDGKYVYTLTTSGSLGNLAPLLCDITEEPVIAQMQELDAVFTCMLDTKTFLPRRCVLNCIDSDGTFAELLGYAGGVLDCFTMELVYDGYDKVDAAEITESVYRRAQELGEYVEADLTVDEAGCAVVHASAATDSPAARIGTPQYFTLDDGLSNFCNACYSIITDAGTVFLQFSLSQTDAVNGASAIIAELDDAMNEYTEEDAYTEIIRLTEPQTMSIKGKK